MNYAKIELEKELQKRFASETEIECACKQAVEESKSVEELRAKCKAIAEKVMIGECEYL